MENIVINDTNQFLTFMLNNDVYSIDIFKVQSVLDYEKITPVPNTPHYMCGVINLRGSVVPVIDLRLRLGMNETPKTKDTCIIIIEIELDGQHTTIGLLADSVQEVCHLDASDIEPAPRLGTRLNIDFITGIGKSEEGFITILDIEKIFSVDELMVLAADQNYVEVV